MNRFHIKTLGEFRISKDGVRISDLASKPVRCAVFLYIAFKRSVSRDELAALIWPDKDTNRVRHSLNQTLYELRRQFDADIIRSAGDVLMIAEEVKVDALEFETAIEEENHELACEIYDGRFLQGVHFGLANEFESWADRTRFDLERRFRDVCRQLIAARLKVNDKEAALSIVQKWVHIDPLEDEAQHQLIQLLAELGRRAEALHQFERYRELIARELEVEPLDETTELVRKIREDKTSVIREDAGESVKKEKSPANKDAKRVDIPVEEPDDLPKPANRRRKMTGVAVALLLLIIAGYYFASFETGESEPGMAGVHQEPHGIAVLPFVNMSADPDQEYFADGITEDLLTSLTKLERTRVISRTSVMRYKNSEKSLPEIAAELNVAYILEGSVRRDQNNVRITAQLIEVADDNHLWAETYDRVLTDIFEVKSDIAQRIAEALEQRLLSGDRDRIARGGTDNLTAYDFLLRGRDYLNRPGEAERSKYLLAEDFFRQALIADPEFSRAYAAISEVYRRNVLLPLTVRRDSMLVYAQRAVQLDSELAEAATELGYAWLFAWDHDRSEDEFRRALELDPNQTDAMSGLGRLSVLNGDLAGAIDWERLAVSIDPLSTERLYNLGYYLFNIGELERSEAIFERIVTLVPEHPTANYLLAHIHLIHGRLEMADKQMSVLEQLAPAMPTVLSMQAKYQTHLGRFDAAKNYMARTDAADFGAFRVLNAFVELQLGRHDRAEELIRQPAEMLALWEQSGLPPPPRGLFHIHLIRGETEAAMSVLRQHWRTGLIWIEDPPEIGIYWIDRQPIVEPLLDHPDFQALLNQIRSTFDEIRIQLEPEIPGVQFF
jgi:TolB-like protein/DNA-binding SARP family transcriptional activator/Flp pilus assembly protein TadD